MSMRNRQIPSELVRIDSDISMIKARLSLLESEMGSLKKERVRRSLLNIAEAAMILGRTEAAIRGLLRRGQIPHIKQNGRVLFNRVVLEKWVSSG